MNGILDKKVSFQDHAWSPISKEETIGEVLNNIRLGKYRAFIETLRSYLDNNEIEKYKDHKRRLPCVVFCGTFENTLRQLSSLKKYNELIIIDIDNVQSSDINDVKHLLFSDNYIVACWISPSNIGIKGIVELDYSDIVAETDNNIKHNTAFIKVMDYFYQKYNIQIDKSGSDITRLCFYSYDEFVLCKERFQLFPILKEDISVNKIQAYTYKNKIIHQVHPKRNLFNPTNRNNHKDKFRINSIIKYLSKREKSITYDYTHWYRVAFAIASTFTFDLGERYFLELCRLDGNRHNEEESKHILQYCYLRNRHEITLGTIVKYTQELGYKKLGGSA